MWPCTGCLGGMPPVLTASGDKRETSSPLVTLCASTSSLGSAESALPALGRVQSAASLHYFSPLIDDQPPSKSQLLKC